MLRLLAVLLAASAALSAQTSYGSIKGYVTDATGGLVPAARIEVSGPALIGRIKVETDGDGFYRLNDLPPGEYTVSAEKAGFSKLERSGLLVRAGQVIGVDLSMKVGNVTEVVEVKGDAPLLETEKAERTIFASGEFIRALPLSPGKNWWDALKMVPGVYILGGEGGTIEAHGAGFSSNVFTMDGMDIADVQQNAAGGTQIPNDAIADIKVTTAGHDASSRMAVGANFGIVTKSGGNQVHGSFGSDIQTKWMNDTNIPGGSPADQVIYQYSGSIGGPVIKDKLWYFGTWRSIRQTDGIARSAAAIATLKVFQPDFEPFDRKLPAEQGLIKGTYLLTSKDRVAASVQYNRTLTENNANDPTWTRERALGQYSGGPLYGGNWWHTFGSRATLEVSGSTYKKPFEVQPQGKGPQVAVYNATLLSAGRLSGNGAAIANMGNVASVNRSEQNRSNLNADLGVQTRAKGSHEIRIGTNILPTEYTFINTSSNEGFTTEYRVLRTAGNNNSGVIPFYRRYESPIKIAGTGKRSFSFGLYVQDTWRPSARLSLSFGLRMDKAQTWDTWDEPKQSSWQGGPRFGVAYRLTSNGKNILRASWNRMYDAINNLYAFSEGSLRKEAREEYDTNLDGTFESSFITPAILTRPAPTANANRGQTASDLRQPRTDEWTAGYSRQLPWKMTVESRFIHRNYKDRIVAYDTNGIYESGKFLGYRDVGFNQIFEIQNGEQNWFLYRAFEFTLHKNLSNRLQFLAGYTWARNQIEGTWDLQDPASYLQPNAFKNSKGIGRTVYPASSQFSSLNSNIYYGTGTTPHNYRMNLTYEAKYGITIGLSHLYMQGQWSGPIFTLAPTSAVMQPTTIVLSNGRSVTNPLSIRQRFYYSTRDENQIQAPSINTLNIRVGKVFKLEKGGRIEAAMSAFNFFNQGEDLYFNAPTLVEGLPNTWTRRLTQAPRAGQLTLRWEF